MAVYIWNSMKKASLLILFLSTMSAKAQLSMADPQICHDSLKYLRCYNDGYFFIAFKKSKVTQVRTTDHDFAYDPKDRIVSFSRDSLQLKLLPAGVMVKKGTDSVVINSVNDFPQKFSLFQIKAESKSAWRGIVHVNLNGKRFEIEIFPGLVSEAWDWEIVMYDAAKWLYVKPVWNRRNRIDDIGLNDDLLKCGVNVSSYFRSGKKVWWLSSNTYVDTVLHTVYGDVHQPYPVAQTYKYEYDRKGRLKHGFGKATMKLCDCEVSLIDP
jgi:hypothetical protein